VDLGLFPGEQYIFLVGLVKGKSFFQSVVSNPSSDVQKLFLVIRDGSSNITYKISKPFLQATQKIIKNSTIDYGHVKCQPSSLAPFYH
jgi:hypothetical protein